MDTLKFSAEKTLSCINQKWCTLFPYTYLSFSDSSGKNGISWDKMHGSIRKKGDSDELPVVQSMKVSTFEDLYEATFDVKVEIKYQKNGKLYRSTDKHIQKTLNEFNFWAKENGASKIFEKNPNWFLNNCLIENHIYEIFPEHNHNLRIDVQWGKTFNGAKLWLYESDNSGKNKAQLFRAKHNSDGTWSFLSLISDEYAIDDSSWSGKSCHMWAHNKDNKNQKFILKNSLKGGFYIHCFRDQKFVLDVSQSGGHKTDLLNYQFLGGDNQIFHFKPIFNEFK